ncbi:unnamed protein product [Periconia digitata]|uniref:Heterokaryon incompatibility domain-containing protein n=1 Tax=Periconia digitata TaxID=1303443 RepID=A0A9W4U8G5_9PLEO|nr:unnamed protein product [Periconia digitata]
MERVGRRDVASTPPPLLYNSDWMKSNTCVGFAQSTRCFCATTRYISYILFWGRNMVALHTTPSMAVPDHPIHYTAVEQDCEFYHFDEDELDFSDLHVRYIEPAVTQQLLFPAHSRRQHSQTSSPLSVSNNNNDDDDDAEILLSTLAHLAPSVAKDFTPKPLFPSALPFKLIHDIYDPMGQDDSYIAMSYSWKKSNRATRKTVSPLGDLPFGWVRTVEQFPLPTSKGMFMAVLCERSEGEGLWFDQVCVDQENEVEKAGAIAAMGDVYRNARSVVVVLDDVEVERHEAGALQWWMRQWEGFQDHDVSIWRRERQEMNTALMEGDLVVLSFVERMLDSEWFRSAWCHLEMRMGRNRVFLCPIAGSENGISSIIRFTGSLLLRMLMLADKAASLAPSQRAQIQSLLRILRAPSAIRGKSSDNVGPSPGHCTEQNTSLSAHATSIVAATTDVFKLITRGDPRMPEHLRRLDANRDKISIALNITNTPLALISASPFQRPSIEDECLRKLLLLGLASRDPFALCTTGPPLCLHDGSMSWLSRPVPPVTSVTSLAPPPLARHDVENITQGSDGRAEYVQLDFTFLDLPHRSRPNPAFMSHVQRARDTIDICIQYRIRSHSTLWSNILSYTSQANPHHPRVPTLRNIFIQTLACAFECGLQWLLDIAAQQQGDPTPSSLNTIPAQLSLFQQSIQSLFTPSLPITHFLTTQHPSQIIPSLSFLLTILGQTISSGIPWASGANECSHGPLIVTLPSPQAQSPSNHAPPNKKAVLFAPFVYSKTLLVAVPKALSSSGYNDLSRAWVLTPKSLHTGGFEAVGGRGNAVRWVLRSKSVLAGERQFLEGLDRREGDESEGSGGRKVVHWIYGPGREDGGVF